MHTRRNDVRGYAAGLVRPIAQVAALHLAACTWLHRPMEIHGEGAVAGVPRPGCASTVAPGTMM